MYLLEINKFGLKEYYTTKKATQLLLTMHSALFQNELSFQTDDIFRIRTLQIKLKALDRFENMRIEFGDTKINIIKTELI